MAPTLAVQIVNYRTRAYLERCLASVLGDLQGGELSYEINLLDNDSGEPLDDLAAAHARVSADAAPHNLGFGAGHNRLAARSDADYLWLLNPDTELGEPRTAARLLTALRDSPGARAVGPRLLAADGTPEPYDHGRLHGARAQIALRGGHSYWRATDARREVAWVNGAALLIERAAFTELGGFDEGLFLYKEEEDLCLRLRATGATVVYVPDVSVGHVGRVVADPGRWRPQSERYFIAKHLTDGPARRMFEFAHHGLAYLHL
jgi:N-acetylglucosaminyl-diphospho-decaprenol L-rhamnosyltransferase